MCYNMHMTNQMQSGKTKYHIMMVILVIVWGLELAIAKDALEHVDKLLILNVKYFFGFFVIAVVAKRADAFHLPALRDLPLIIATTIIGHILYFFCEYSALDSVPVANITIILGFLPIASILVEKALFHRKTSIKLIVFMLVCVVGIFLVIGSDFSSMRGGSFYGYLFCGGALLCWLAYLFLTESLTNKYGAIPIALFQTIIAWVITTPVVFPQYPGLLQLPVGIMLELLYLGIVSEGICFLIEITGLEKLGPTISAVYSNFLPVTSAFFGFVLLHQNLVLLQIIGGLVVIASGYLVIREKDRLDRLA